MQGDKPKNQKPRLMLKKGKSKEKKGVKEKVHERPNLKYEPLHRRKKREEGCMVWMTKISWAPKISKGYARD